MRGPEAASIFYDDERFTRRRAMPVTVVKLLQDFGSVQTLDGASHRHRKAMFLRLLEQSAAEQIQHMFGPRLRDGLLARTELGSVVLFDEARAALTDVALKWTGVSATHSQRERRRDEFSAMIQNVGTLGPSHLHALLLRWRCERWAQEIVNDVRKGKGAIPANSPAAVIASHRDNTGDFLSPDVAAVELINLWRPIVAVSRFIVFAAKSLYEQPGWREKIAAGDDDALNLFVEEVRRASPFFPVIGGRVSRSFRWLGHEFKPGLWVLLDLYGTNHDPATWDVPEAFRPERLHRQDLRTGYAFVPQGAGNPVTTHRCPGEDVTVALMKAALRVLTQEITFKVPPQDLSVDFSRMPALPKSGFLMKEVRPWREMSPPSPT